MRHILWTGMLLLLAIMVTLGVAQDDTECWQLVEVRTIWQRYASGEISEMTADEAHRVASSISLDDSWQWIEYRNPNYTGGNAAARAGWSPPPQRFCSMDSFMIEYTIENLAINDGANNYAVIHWGPESIYGRRGSGLYLAYNEASASKQHETVIGNGQLSLDDPATWRMYVEIGDLIAQVYYHYLPVGDLPASEPLLSSDNDFAEPIDVNADCIEIAAPPPEINSNDPVIISWILIDATQNALDLQLQHVNHEVTLDSRPLQFQDPTIDTAQRYEYTIDGVIEEFWFVDWQVPVGMLAPGQHEVKHRMTWDTVLIDGFGDEIGPGTSLEEWVAHCVFTVQDNGEQLTPTSPHDDQTAIDAVVQEILNPARTIIDASELATMAADQQTVLDEFGPPDSFTRMVIPDAVGRWMQYELWSYFDAYTTFIFLDGVFQRSEFVERPGNIEPTPYLPAHFLLGMPLQGVQEKFPNGTWIQLTEMEGFLADYGASAELWASDRLILAFVDNQLVFVQAMAFANEEGIG